jgi:hypothetical protein
MSMVSKVITCLKAADFTIPRAWNRIDERIPLQSGSRHRLTQLACLGWNQGPVILAFLVVACK